MKYTRFTMFFSWLCRKDGSMRDRNYEQALQELVERNQKGLKEALEERQLRLAHATVASLVADMPEDLLKDQTTDVLKFMKIIGSLDTLRLIGKWSEEEYQELHEYFLAIHQKVSQRD